ncbi:hypothetical protein AMECASPLE_037360 [Ameca splendens]|uniref:Uncharacterized protein n=1 Tax=Ameca splendens TaxID=208324 RepID=A0ABV0XWW1_9TELE
MNCGEERCPRRRSLKKRPQSLNDWENRSARPLLCRELLWDSLLLQASERNKETSAGCSSPIPMITGGKGWLVGVGVLLFRQLHHGKPAATPRCADR